MNCCLANMAFVPSAVLLNRPDSDTVCEVGAPLVNVFESTTEAAFVAVVDVLLLQVTVVASPINNAEPAPKLVWLCGLANLYWSGALPAVEFPI